MDNGIIIPPFTVANVQVTVHRDEDQQYVTPELTRFVWIAIDPEGKTPLGGGTLEDENVALAVCQAFREIAKIQEVNFRKWMQDAKDQNLRSKLTLDGSIPPLRVQR